MIERLLGQRTFRRWLIYFVSNVVVAIYLFVIRFEYETASVLSVSTSLVIAVVVTLTASQILAKKPNRATDQSERLHSIEDRMSFGDAAGRSSAADNAPQKKQTIDAKQIVKSD